ncbi:MAG TPA: thermonuclease family protein [Thermomicrobiales bacterium]|nr:thermonuclease family protein [Thermomicrobiales bacterium]
MRRFFWLLVLVALLTGGCDVEMASESSTARSGNGSDENVRVVRVVDGDTISVEIDGREERLRYIGIDTPESVQPNTPVECFGIEASEENKRLVEGKRVVLERDVSNRDRYDRLLRYVYVVDGSTRTFVNQALVEGGFAFASSFPPDVKYQDQLRAAQRKARDEGRGLWGACTP